MDAIKLCDEILMLIEDLPDRACEFRESVEGKVLGIKENIERFDGNATDNQIRALQNMKAGVERWLH